MSSWRGSRKERVLPVAVRDLLKPSIMKKERPREKMGTQELQNLTARK
jgi:hypothetical protein